MKKQTPKKIHPAILEFLDKAVINKYLNEDQKTTLSDIAKILTEDKQLTGSDLKTMIKDFWERLVFNFNSWRNTRDFNAKVKEADKRHKITGKQYHVVPFGKNTMKVVNNDFLKFYNSMLKKQGRKPINIFDLAKMSYYTTASDTRTRKELKKKSS
jgi:hypothetical protein